MEFASSILHSLRRGKCDDRFESILRMFGSGSYANRSRSVAQKSVDLPAWFIVIFFRLRQRLSIMLVLDALQLSSTLKYLKQ